MNESGTPIVQLRNVSKKIGGKTIIDKLSFDVPRGEVFGFLGPNGAGKTTTIRMMVGLMSITEGEIMIEGASIAKDFEKAIRHVGAIVENPEMYKFLSGYQNLLHYARMREGIARERIDEVVSLVGLSNRIHEKVKTYSLGMRQRLGVAQALLHRPSLLILDEPTNGLDPAGIRELRDYLRKLSREENIAVVVSSHLLSEMELMCDKVAIIQNGRLIDVRTVKGDQLEGSAAVVQLEAEPSEQALEVARSFDESAAVRSGKLEVALKREDIPKLNAQLVAAGIQVYSIQATTKSLEDVFLEMTGGDQIA
ncbi:ABC transporter ATP-binding protein [Xylanibacillus composti]|uniref:Putative ABC transporter ATP-binding protein YhcH n=1 Tax=Xylanibacillus composti TaxID=1572762 RepID=A0A8J4H444_9BACL|nr:ABC transporter ATP-binding protein [Xylanibacillus composti]MDT9725825.1 ABC transporter ATP-binding protein [Xylanibacillus composti]GIQ69221.1 putative ABC transporter ATP-binding protein YhcH [Xylanibacillus composti]